MLPGDNLHKTDTSRSYHFLEALSLVMLLIVGSVRAEPTALQANSRRDCTDPVPRNPLFFDSFEKRLDANGKHGWTRILSKGTEKSMGPNAGVVDLTTELKKTDRVTFSKGNARHGAYALGILVKDGDHIVDSDRKTRNERTELVRRYLTTGEGTDGDQRWYGFSFKLSKNFPTLGKGDFAIITQFLKENNSRAPYPNPTISVVLKYRDSKFLLELYTRQRSGLFRRSWKVVTYQLGELKPDVWTDFAFNIRWSLADDGYWQIWRDRKLVATRSHLATLPGIEHSTFHKIGFYRSDSTTSFFANYDAYWMSKTAPAYATSRCQPVSSP